MNIRKVKLYGEFYLPVSDPASPSELIRLGFMEKEGRLEPPDFLNPSRKYPLKLKDWPKHEKTIVIDENARPVELVKITYPETLIYREGLITLEITPKLYGEQYREIKNKLVYQLFNESSVNTLKDWLSFPIKAYLSHPNLKPSLPKPTDMLVPITQVFKADQKFLQKLLEEISDKNGEFADKLGFLDGVRNISGYKQEHLTPAIPHREGVSENSMETIELTDWHDVIFAELKHDVALNLAVRICANPRCHLPIYLTDGKGMRDRVMHNRLENPECFRSQLAVRKARSRRT